MMANTWPSRWENNLLLVRREYASLIVAQAPHKRLCCDGRLMTDDQPRDSYRRPVLRKDQIRRRFSRAESH
jgi:hypothetical protein